MRSARQRTHALLRAHLLAVAGVGHRTERCGVCRHLLNQAMRLPTLGPTVISERLNSAPEHAPPSVAGR